MRRNGLRFGTESVFFILASFPPPPAPPPMIYRFPFETALLPRTKLAYANLPGILSDGKRDRQGRLAGFVAVQLGERCFLVFLRHGEPFFAVRMTPRERGQAALSEVLRLAGAESERGETGHIGFYAAPEEQLQAMLATIVQDPLPHGHMADASTPERLFPVLRERAFSGILELLCPDGAHHYLCFRRGAFHCGWFTGRDHAIPVPNFIRTLFDGAPPRAGLFPELSALPVQAAPGLVDLYRRLIGGTLREVALSTGPETALELVERAQRIATAEHEMISAFTISAEGRVAGDPLATPDALTDAVARWVTEVLVAAGDDHGVDPAAIVERVGHDSRFVLRENGFFARLPWTTPL